jgi:hypothetical protein
MRDRLAVMLATDSAYRVLPLYPGLREGPGVGSLRWRRDR